MAAAAVAMGGMMTAGDAISAGLTFKTGQNQLAQRVDEISAGRNDMVKAGLPKAAFWAGSVGAGAFGHQVQQFTSGTSHTNSIFPGNLSSKTMKTDVEQRTGNTTIPKITAMNSYNSTRPPLETTFRNGGTEFGNSQSGLRTGYTFLGNQIQDRMAKTISSSPFSKSLVTKL